MRRVIRIKAMQGLYSFFNNKTVNRDDIRHKTSEGLIEIPEFYNATQQEKNGFRQLLPVLLDEAFQNGVNIDDLPENQRWLGKLAMKAVADWRKENQNELGRIRAGMVRDLHQQAAVEVGFWQLFTNLLESIRQQEDRKVNQYLNNEPSPEYTLKILNHPFYPLLNKALHPEKGEPPLGYLPHDPELVQRIFPLLFKDLPEYNTYKNLKESSPQQDEEIFKVLYRKLFKSAPFNEVMAERDLHWSENRVLLEVSLKNTFKSLALGDVPTFAVKKEEMEEFIQFFNTLLDSVLENFESDEEMMSKVVTNWDNDRIAVLDKWIIHLSLNEMRKFPHIPIKVTMNEYLEIAKAYSTPGSASFINGVTDRMAQKMKETGSIRKSAKGLMDNK